MARAARYRNLHNSVLVFTAVLGGLVIFKMIKLYQLPLMLLGLTGLASSAPATSSSHAAAAWPNGPLVTSGRWILDASGSNVTLAGANWPGAGETMLPEGLQYQSVQTIVSKIKSIGMNAIRLTYAIQMIDEIYQNGGKDISIQTAFTKGLGAANGMKVLNQVLAKNPSFTAETTRLQVREEEEERPPIR